MRFLLLLLAYIEQLDDCQKLHTLILQDNVIDSISNIEWCRELWIIDLSGNRVREERERRDGGGRERERGEGEGGTGLIFVILD